MTETKRKIALALGTLSVWLGGALGCGGGDTIQPRASSSGSRTNQATGGSGASTQGSAGSAATASGGSSAGTRGGGGSAAPKDAGIAHDAGTTHDAGATMPGVPHALR